MITQQEIFSRAELLLGSDAMTSLNAKRVIVFGVGGVGSWCAEALVRSGIREITIVDADNVAASNINRQLMATTLTVGRPKVDVLKERLLTINPEAHITALKAVFTAETAPGFAIGSYDYVVDAIDSLKDKALLILTACRSEARLFSSMGAALKTDPSHISTAEFWKVSGDPLARALRKKFKAMKLIPERKFVCVFSDELLTNRGQQPSADTYEETPQLFHKPQTKGSLVHITAIFGFTLAGLIVQDAIGAGGHK